MLARVLSLLSGLLLLATTTLAAEPPILTATLKQGLYRLQVSFAAPGQQAVTQIKDFVVDTGSIGIIAHHSWVTTTEAEDKDTHCDIAGYSSSQRFYLGHVRAQDVTITSTTDASAVSSAALPVLAGIYRCQAHLQPGRHPQSCHSIAQAHGSACEVMSADTSVRYLGIGFARKEAVLQQWHQHVNVSNPLLNVQAPSAVASRRSYALATVLKGSSRQLQIHLGVEANDLNTLIRSYGYRDPLYFPLTAASTHVDFEQPLIAYRVLTAAGKTDLDTQRARLNGTGQVPLLPDTGLNTLIMAFPGKAPPCTEAKADYQAGQSAICPHSASPVNTCPYGQHNTAGRSLFAGSSVVLLQNNHTPYYTLTLDAGKHASLCGRYSVSAKQPITSNSYVLNTGRALLNECLWYMNADQPGPTQGDGFAALSCR